MTMIAAIFKELLGLFVDDGSLALGIVVLVIALAAALYAGLNPLIAGPALFVACVALLVENLLRTIRAKRR